MARCRGYGWGSILTWEFGGRESIGEGSLRSTQKYKLMVSPNPRYINRLYYDIRDTLKEEERTESRSWPSPCKALEWSAIATYTMSDSLYSSLSFILLRGQAVR